MHTLSETGTGVPAFLAKLWRLVEDAETNDLICWSKDGRSFIIQNQAQFARELLPLNYKHNNMASFIRQLNMYGFHKITSIDNGGLKFDRDEMEFSHPCFKRNHAYLLEHIKRKIANTKAIDEKTSMKPEAVSKVLNDVKVMRGRQDSLDSRFSAMKQENEALWREIASLRQKHAKQQQIVNKLIQFLITIVQHPSRNMTSVKRHMQLMINNAPEKAKIRCNSESEEDSGPIIHELGEELLDEVVDSENEDLIDSSSPYYLPSSPHEEGSASPLISERPCSNASAISQNFEYADHIADNATSTAGSIINAVNADGSQIVYHVTEVPDHLPEDSKSDIKKKSKLILTENGLATPMVKKAMARSQLKEKNKRRRLLPETNGASTSVASEAKVMKSQNNDQEIKIKTESNNEIDPLIFLNVNYPGAEVTNINTSKEKDPQIFLPDRDHSLSNDTSAEMYNTSDFFNTDMPSDLFEESTMLSDNFDEDDNFELKKNQSQSVQAIKDNKNAYYDGAPGCSPSTSNGSTKNPSVSQEKNTNNMAVTKYRQSPFGSDEAAEHIEGVQDELDSLKDLLRSDEYSIDASTLLNAGSNSNSRLYLSPALDGDLLNKLFGDSEILGPYGLNLSTENQQERKGSEVITYQPMYDLSDIVDINEEEDLADLNNTARQSRLLQRQSSVLNTPLHE